jgi:hypothetical protein
LDQTGVGTARRAESATALPAERMVQNAERSEGVMDQNSGSWNRLTSWLRKVEALGQAA